MHRMFQTVWNVLENDEQSRNGFAPRVRRRGQAGPSCRRAGPRRGPAPFFIIIIIITVVIIIIIIIKPCST